MVSTWLLTQDHWRNANQKNTPLLIQENSILYKKGEKPHRKQVSVHMWANLNPWAGAMQNSMTATPKTLNMEGTSTPTLVCILKS